MATLGEKATGDIVKLNVGGVSKNFVVWHQGLPGSKYDTSCDGTWLVMEELCAVMAWDSSNNDYENSTVHSYLNSTFLTLLDTNAQNLIKQVKIPYTKGTGSGGTVKTGADGLSTKVFLLSYVEARKTTSSSIVNIEGSVLKYGSDNNFAVKGLAKYNGTTYFWWTRSPYKTNTTNVFVAHTNGYSNFDVTKTYGVRPAFILPQEINVSDDGTIVVSSGAITGSVNIGGVQRELTGEGYINIDGVLRELSESQVNIGGTIKSLKG